MSQEDVEIVREALNAWIEVDEGLADPGRLAEFMSPDAVFMGDVLETDIRGLDGFLEWRAGWIAAYDDWSYSAEDVVDAGSGRVVATFHQRGRLRGTESWVEMRYAIEYTVENGLITRGRVYATPEEALKAAGLSE